MKSKKMFRFLMLFATSCLLLVKSYGQAYVLYDFEDGVVPPVGYNMSIETENPDPNGGNYYLRVLFSGYDENDYWWTALLIENWEVNLETMENPYLVFDYNTGEHVGFMQLNVGYSHWYYKPIGYLHSADWKQMAIPVKEYLQGPEDSTSIDWADQKNFALEFDVWLMPKGSEFEVNIDNVFLKSESQIFFDFEDGLEPEELPEFSIETTDPAPSGGTYYLKVVKPDITQLTWIGAAEKQIPITNLSVYNNPLVSFLYHTGANKGYLQLEVGDNADMKWGYSIGQLESASWTQIDIPLFEIEFSNWDTDPLDWSKVKYVKIGFTTGDLEEGSDYEISIDNIKLKEIPQNYEPLLKHYTMMGNINNNLIFTPELFESRMTDFENDTLVSLKFVTLPDTDCGVLTLDDVPLSEEQEITKTDIENLEFVPAANWSGTCSMKWTVSDGEFYPDGADLTITISHYPNMALNRPVEACGPNAYYFVFPGQDLPFYKDYANDGYWISRWTDYQRLGTYISEGVYADTVWIYVDFGTLQEISALEIYWESAYAINYLVEVSEDAIAWDTVKVIEDGDGGRDRISFSPVTAQYIRIYTLTGNMQDLPSIWEFGVYSSLPPTYFPVENIISGTVENVGDYAGMASLYWDTDSVYLLFEIKDDSLVTEGDAWLVDNIEIYFDMDNSKNIHWPRNGEWITNDTTFDENDYQLRLVPEVDWETNNSLNGANQEYTRMADGYDFTLSILWDSLMPGFVPEIGEEIGFDVLVSDNDVTANQANRNQISWNSPTTFLFNDPSLWGVLQFAEDGTFLSIPDDEIPTTPQNFQAVASGQDIALTWDPSEDNRVVQCYILNADLLGVIDTVLAKPTGNGYLLEDLASGSYTIQIVACDPYWNRSIKSTIHYSPTGVIDQEPEISPVFFPNPANDRIHVINKASNQTIIEIYRMSGELVFSRRMFGDEDEIVIDNLARGIYIVVLKDLKNVYVTKLIKQ